jgi:Domain of unknown function (DUF4426)
MRHLRWPALLLFAVAAQAAQFRSLGDLEVHYMVVNTLFLDADIAARYGIVRARDRAILNVSVIGPDGLSRDADVTGTARNLLEQTLPLEFRRIEEGEAIYFIAPLRHTDQEVLRFRLTIDDRQGTSGEIEFQERLWVQAE